MLGNLLFTSGTHKKKSTIAARTAVVVSAFFALALPSAFAQTTPLVPFATDPATTQTSPFLNATPSALTPPPTTLPSFTGTNQAQINAAAGTASVQTTAPATDTSAPTAADGTRVATGGTKPTENTSDHCTNSITSIGDCIRNLPGYIAAGIAMLFLSISGLFLFISGTIFNVVLVHTVFQFATYFGNSEGMLIAWGILRDIGNILLLFGFIFMGIATILDLHSYSAKKALPTLVIFAVLLNFSLFVSEVVIDTANGLATTFATQVGDSCGGNESINTSNAGGGVTAGANDCVNLGVSGKIAAAAGIGSVFDVKGGLTTLLASPWKYSASLMLLSVFVLIAAIVLLAGAIMLIVRVVTLSFIIVLSPIGFAGMAIPKLHGMANEWWNKLFSQAFFAPVYLLLIFMSLKMVEGFGGAARAGEQGSLADALINNGNLSMDTVLMFVIVIGFMIGSLLVAKKMGAVGANFATSAAKNIVTYPLGVAGRTTLGRGSSAVLKKYESSMGNLRASTGFGGILARSPLGSTADELIGGGLTRVKKTNFGTAARSYADEKKYQEERTKHLGHAAEEAHLEGQFADAINDGEPATEAHAKAVAEREAMDAPGAVATDAEKQAKDAEVAALLVARQATDDRIAAIMQKMSVHSLETNDLLKSLDKNVVGAIARNLSPEKFRAVMSSKEVGEATKDSMRGYRFADAQQQVEAKYAEAERHRAAGNAQAEAKAKSEAKAIMAQYTAKDLENAPPDFLRSESVQKAMSSGTREDLAKSGNVDPAVARTLRSKDPVEKAKAAYNNPPAGVSPGAAAAAIINAEVDTAKLSKLPEHILMDTDVMNTYGKKELSQLKRAGLSGPVIDAISANVSARAAAGNAALTAYLGTEDGGWWSV